MLAALFESAEPTSPPVEDAPLGEMQALLATAPIDEMSAEFVDNMLQITEHIQRNAAVLAERSSSASV